MAKLINDFWFPDYDNHCSKVTIMQSPDMDCAIKYCRETNCVIQAGGNVGVWAKRLSSIFDQVHTFEPDPDNFECLKKNIEGIENIFAYRRALGKYPDTKSIRQVPGNCGANNIVDGEDVIVTTIDSLGLKPDLIILDVEGYEEFALLGGVQTIWKHKPVLMYEDKDLSIEYTGHGKGYIEEWMKEYGYTAKKRIHRDVILVCQ